MWYAGGNGNWVLILLKIPTDMYSLTKKPQTSHSQLDVLVPRGIKELIRSDLLGQLSAVSNCRLVSVKVACAYSLSANVSLFSSELFVR